MADPNLARGRRGKARDQPQRGGLAATRRPEQRNELAPIHAEVKRPQRHDAAIKNLGHAAQADRAVC
jgi:hypothetical protein